MDICGGGVGGAPDHFDDGELSDAAGGIGQSGGEFAYGIDLEIHAHRDVHHGFATKESVHLPAGVKPEEISQQRTSRTKTITTCKGTDTAGSQLYIQCAGSEIGIVAGYGERRTGDVLWTSIPCRTNVEELYDLEIP